MSLRLFNYIIPGTITNKILTLNEQAAEFQRLAQLAYPTTSTNLPAGHYLPRVFFKIALLCLPTLGVVTWVVEHLFFSTTAFSWQAFGDLVLPLGSGISAGAVSAFRNPMHSLLALLAVFFCTALIYLIAGMAFVGLVFLIVYVGAVAVLFLFVIMLLNVKSLTSTEDLITHRTQTVAITFAIILLLQITLVLLGASEYVLSTKFLQDVLLTPESADAIRYHVLYCAMDVNRLISLYTTHGVLLMVTTTILLAALLGAIILATVTTERATSVSDIRPYSQKAATRVAALSCVALLLVTFADADTEVLFTQIADAELDPILFSFYYKEAMRDQDFRTSRKLKQDSYVTHNYQFSTKHRPLRRFLRARVRLWEGETRWMLKSWNNEEVGTAACKRIYEAEDVTPLEIDQFLNTKRFRRWFKWKKYLRLPLKNVYFANAALSPVLERRYVGLSSVRIMRRRWLWRWRRDRAAWLRRSQIEYAEIYKYASAEDKEKYYPRYPTRRRGGLGEYKYDYFRRIARRIRPGLRVFGKKRNISFSTFLHLITVTKVYSSIFYWAWRIRAFCLYFICFVFIVPFMIAPVWLFVEEQNGAWTALVDIHALTSRLVHDYTELKHFDQIYANIAALFIMVPATVWAISNPHPILLISIALLFAWDAVTSHGGVLSDWEFQESRCNYWRKDFDDYKQEQLDIAEAEMRVRSKIHPDKGRTDFLPGWLVHIFNLIEDKVLDFVVHIAKSVWALIEVILSSRLWACFTGTVKIIALGVWNVACFFAYTIDTAIFAVADFIFPPEYRPDIMPVLARAMQEGRRLLREFIQELGRLLLELIRDCVAILWPWIRSAWELLWSYTRWVFYKIEYHPKFLEALNYTTWAPLSYTIVITALMVATVLYFVSVFALLVPWRRVYGPSIQRQPAKVYAAVALFALYVGGVLAQRALPFFYFQDYPEICIWEMEHEFYRRYIIDWFYGREDLLAPIEDYFYQSMAVIAFVYNVIYQIIRRKYMRDRSLNNAPLVFRSYFNYWLRGMYTFYATPMREKFEAKMKPFSSTEEAYTAIFEEERVATQVESAAEIEKAATMKWIRVKYIPKYYDPHPDLKYRKHRWAYAYVVENHYKNPHHSV